MTGRVTQQHFDAKSGDYYRRNYEAPRSRHERGLALRREVCLDLLDPAHHRVLDLGCGPGALALPLAAQGRATFAMDLSPKMVAQARQLICAEVPSGQVGYAVADAERLPFADAAFDAIVTTGVLEYVPRIEHTISEMRRVLRPGGVVVATVSLPRQLEREVTRRFGPLALRLKGAPAAPPGPAPFHRAFAASEFDALLGAAGFHVDARRFSYFTPFPLDAIAPALVTMVDRRLGRMLERVSVAREQAKTYIVRASRG